MKKIDEGDYSARLQERLLFTVDLLANIQSVVEYLPAEESAKTIKDMLRGSFKQFKSRNWVEYSKGLEPILKEREPEND